MIELHFLLKYLNKLLEIDKFNFDIAINGLQVEGSKKIAKIITGVSASIELFEKAEEEKADCVIVHHGLFWYGKPVAITGNHYRRVKILIRNNINLLAYHLPLDAHIELGNNFLIAKTLGLENLKPFGEFNKIYIGCKGETNYKIEDFKTLCERAFRREPLIFPFGPKFIKKVGIISGAAQKELVQAIEEGLDTYITGEVSEWVMHMAKENNINFISAGHYATETFGIKALGQHISDKFDVEVKFIDIPNPV